MTTYKIAFAIILVYVKLTCSLKSDLKNDLKSSMMVPSARKYSDRLNVRSCQSLAVKPNFDPDVVLRSAWRVYFTWNHDWSQKCVDIYFKKATEEIEQRFRTDMHDFLLHQPNWGEATLLMTIGRPDHQMLLFPDASKPQGTFYGLLNYRRDTRVTLQENSVPLLSFVFRLLNDGKVLAFADCGIGIACLASRLNQPVYRQEIVAAAMEVDIDNGAFACMEDDNPNEIIALPERWG